MKKYIIPVLCVMVILCSLGCGTIEEIRVEDFDIQWDDAASTITLTCMILNSYNQTKKVTIRGWFDPHGNPEEFRVGGPRTYDVPPPSMGGKYGETEVQFVLTGVPEFSDACWGFDWSEGVIDMMDEGYDAYDMHYEEENFSG